jgi:DNA-binding transcriptional LysR family regulator
VRLLERSTRNLRLTDVGAQVLEHAQRSAEPSEAVDNLVLNQLSTVARVLRLSAPPSISDTPLAPLLGAFQDELRCQRKGLCRMQSAAGEGRAARMLTAWWELSKHPRSSRRCLPADKSRIVDPYPALRCRRKSGSD